MSKYLPGTDPLPRPPKSASGFLRWFPWEKLLIWGLFVGAIYILRDFFFVIFMTFLISYIMRGVIVRVTWLVTRRREVPWLERVLAAVCFGLLFYGFYEIGSFLGPPLRAQCDALVGRVARFEPEAEFRNLGAKTVGAYLFRRQYGDRDDAEYQEAFKEHLTSDTKSNRVEYERFRMLQDEINGGFDLYFQELGKDEIKKRVAPRLKDDEAFDKWFLEAKALSIFESGRDEKIAEWERLEAIFNRQGLDAKRKEPDFEAWRDRRILEWILADVKSNPEELPRYRQEWKDELERQDADQWKASEEYVRYRQQKFREFYEDKRRSDPKRFPEFSTYLELEAAFQKGEPAFAEALGEERDLSDAVRVERQHHNFVLEKQQTLFNDWWGDTTAIELRSAFKRYTDKFDAFDRVKIAINYIFSLSVQLSLSLLLSFFITVDIPTLRKGVRKLERSRISGLYTEIAPGLSSFGHLIGRAFQAQGVIAIFNTLLTFLAIRLLGIENEAFLCSIVFLCSFIPVFGVVLSSVPIAVMAIIQPGGDVTKALEIIAAILVIHFIETSVLNPKILGDMLHLHPVLVLTVLAVGQHFFGVWGLLLGVPVAVYVIRFVILNEGIPGFIEPVSAAEPGVVTVSPSGEGAASLESAGDGEVKTIPAAAPGSAVLSPPSDAKRQERGEEERPAAAGASAPDAATSGSRVERDELTP